jgi:hypothetical protein
MSNLSHALDGWSLPRWQPDLSVRLVDGEAVIYDRQGGLIHQLNYTASIVWRQCDGNSTITDIVQQIAHEFDVELEVARQDVLTILGQLHQLHLLKFG